MHSFIKSAKISWEPMGRTWWTLTNSCVFLYSYEDVISLYHHILCYYIIWARKNYVTLVSACGPQVIHLDYLGFSLANFENKCNSHNPRRPRWPGPAVTGMGLSWLSHQTYVRWKKNIKISILPFEKMGSK